MRDHDQVLVAVLVEIHERHAGDLAHQAGADAVDGLVAGEGRGGGVVVEPHLDRALAGRRRLGAHEDVGHAAAAAVDGGHRLDVAVVRGPVVLGRAVVRRQEAFVVVRALREPHEEVAGRGELRPRHEIRPQLVVVLVERVHRHRHHRVGRQARVTARSRRRGGEERRVRVLVEPHRDVVRAAGIGAEDQVLVGTRVLRVIAVPVALDQVRGRERQHTTRRERDDLEARDPEVLVRRADRKPQRREVARRRRKVSGIGRRVRRVVDGHRDAIAARRVGVGVAGDVHAAVVAHAHPHVGEPRFGAVQHAIAIEVHEHLAGDLAGELVVQAERIGRAAPVRHDPGFWIRRGHDQRVRLVAVQAVGAHWAEQRRVAVGISDRGIGARRTRCQREVEARQIGLARVLDGVGICVSVRVDRQHAARAGRVRERAGERGVRDEHVERVGIGVRAVAHRGGVLEQVAPRGGGDLVEAGGVRVADEVAEAHLRSGEPDVAAVLDVVQVQVVEDVAGHRVELGSEVGNAARGVDLALERGLRIGAPGVRARRRGRDRERDALDVRQLVRRNRAAAPVPGRRQALHVDREQRRHAGVTRLSHERHALGRAAVVVGDVTGRVAVDLAHEHVVGRVRRRRSIGALGRGDVGGVHCAVVVDVERVADQLGAGAVAPWRRVRRPVERGRLGVRGGVVGKRGRRTVREGFGVGRLVLRQDDLRRVHVRDRLLRDGEATHEVVAVDPVSGRPDVARHQVERGARRLFALDALARTLLALRGRHEHHAQRHRDQREDRERHHEFDEREAGGHGATGVDGPGTSTHRDHRLT